MRFKSKNECFLYVLQVLGYIAQDNDKISFVDVNDDFIKEIRIAIENHQQDIKKVSTELNFVSMSKTSDTTNLNLDIRPKKFEELIKITDLIKKKYEKAKIIVARSNNLNL